MKILFLACLVMMWTFALCISAYPQKADPQEIQETIDWIGNKFINKKFYYFISIYEIKYRESPYSFFPDDENLYTLDGCVLTLQGKHFEDKTKSAKLIIPFADVEPLSIKRENKEKVDSIIFQTTNSKKTIKYIIGNQVEMNYENLEIIFGKAQSENLSRFKQAITDAVKLCGGRVEKY